MDEYSETREKFYKKYCILISSCDKYSVICRYTYEKIKSNWKNHPDIFVSGLSDKSDKYENIIPSNNIVRWSEVVQNALHEIRLKGYQYVYLIFDDHPPLYKCSEKHLNTTIPDLMCKLNATHVYLNGWGQGRALTGEDLGKEYYHMEKYSSDEKYKFALDIGLWNIERLHHILETQNNKAWNSEFSKWYHTPQFFEKMLGIDQDVPALYKESCYRIHGQTFLNNRMDIALIKFRLFICKYFKVLQFMLMLFHGPYSTYFAGIMKQGKVNSNYLWFLLLSGQFKDYYMISKLSASKK